MDTLRNEFHRTSIRVRDARKALRALEEHAAHRTPAQRRMAKRLHDALCGSPDCSCGVVRGPQS